MPSYLPYFLQHVTVNSHNFFLATGQKLDAPELHCGGHGNMCFMQIFET